MDLSTFSTLIRENEKLISPATLATLKARIQKGNLNPQTMDRIAQSIARAQKMLTIADDLEKEGVSIYKKAAEEVKNLKVKTIRASQKKDSKAADALIATL